MKRENLDNFLKSSEPLILFLNDNEMIESIYLGYLVKNPVLKNYYRILNSENPIFETFRASQVKKIILNNNIVITDKIVDSANKGKFIIKEENYNYWVLKIKKENIKEKKLTISKMEKVEKQIQKIVEKMQH